MPRPRTLVMRRALALVAVAVVATSCGNPAVTEYGDKAKANFVDACTTSRRIVDKKVVETEVASPSNCACVYESINQTTDDHYLSWDDLADYEEKLADLKDGAEPPAPPKQLEEAVTDCLRTGPTAPDSDDATTTTEPG